MSHAIKEVLQKAQELYETKKGVSPTDKNAAVQSNMQFYKAVGTALITSAPEHILTVQEKSIINRAQILTLKYIEAKDEKVSHKFYMQILQGQNEDYKYISQAINEINKTSGRIEEDMTSETFYQETEYDFGDCFEE